MRVLQLIESQNTPFTNAALQTFDEIDGVPCDVMRLSQHVWALLCGNITNGLHTHRVAYAGGEEYNGFEFWRRLYQDYEGGASEVELAGIRSLHCFPRCPGQHLFSRYIGT